MLCILTATELMCSGCTGPVPVSQSPRSRRGISRRVQPPTLRINPVEPTETQPTLPTQTLPLTPPDTSVQNEWKPKAEARKWKYIVMHHTAAARGDVESIDRSHRGRGWQGIGYHFLIGNGDGMGDGEVEPTFRWRTQIHGAHAGNAEYNEKGIGICLVGNFEETRPTDAQRDSLIQLVQSLAKEYGITEDRVIVHSDVKATKCPGKFFPVNEVLRSVREVAAIQGGPDQTRTNNLAMAQPLRFDSRSAVTGRVAR